MPETYPSRTAMAAAFNETTTGTVFTPTIIMVLVLAFLLTLVVLGTLALSVLRRQCRTSQVSHQVIQIEAQHVKDAYFEVVDRDGKRGSASSFWSRLTQWMPRPSSREPEPELPWPVYSILPHLRPKAPLHVRLVKALMFWRKEQARREPFTMADVQRAKDDIEARSQEALTASVVRSEGRWSPAHIPEIVVHPCDGTPPFKYADGPAVIPPTYVDADPKLDAEPTAPEVECALPLTPCMESSAVCPPLPVADVDSLEVPMPSSTAPKEEEQKEDIANVSNFSGEAFVLAAPPKKKGSSSEAEHSSPTSAADLVSTPAPSAAVDIDTEVSSATFTPELASSTSFTAVAELVASDAIPAARSSTVPSSSTATDADPDYSPASTASELDSPMPLTPIAESHVSPFVVDPSTITMDSPEVAISSPTVSATTKGTGVGELKFEWRRYKASGPDSPLRVGLGLRYEEVQRREEQEPQFVIGELSPANSDDHVCGDSDNASWWLKASSSISSSSSSCSIDSVPDILRVLDGTTSEPSSFLDSSSSSASMDDVSSSPGRSRARTPFSGILGVIKHHFPTSESTGDVTIASSSSRSTYYDILDAYRGNKDDEDYQDYDRDTHTDSSGNASIASGDTDYYGARAPAVGRWTTPRWDVAPLRALARKWAAPLLVA